MLKYQRQLGNFVIEEIHKMLVLIIYLLVKQKRNSGILVKVNLLVPTALYCHPICLAI